MTGAAAPKVAKDKVLRKHCSSASDAAIRVAADPASSSAPCCVCFVVGGEKKPVFLHVCA
jgi:hypothetical protein